MRDYIDAVLQTFRNSTKATTENLAGVALINALCGIWVNPILTAETHKTPFKAQMFTSMKKVVCSLMDIYMKDCFNFKKKIVTNTFSMIL